MARCALTQRGVDDNRIPSDSARCSLLLGALLRRLAVPAASSFTSVDTRRSLLALRRSGRRTSFSAKLLWQDKDDDLFAKSPRAACVDLKRPDSPKIMFRV